MKSRSAFTLVELSIVLVILGLLVGGVLTGQSLIKAAELRSVSTQFARFQTAAMTFRDKYMALPGDMPNAEAYWGQAATGSACLTTPGTGTQTCNGDGNGMVDQDGEIFRFWQHLANAGLIEGNYRGIAASGTYGADSRNVPLGKISSSHWYVSSFGSPLTGRNDIFDGVYTNTFEFGGYWAGMDPGQPILKPEDAYNIDMKMDDGKPGTGKVVIRAFNWLGTCATTNDSSDLTATYQLASTNIQCAFFFRQVF